MNHRLSLLWALIAGLVIVPLAGGTNALVIPLLLGGRWSGDAWLSPYQLIGGSALQFCLSAPLGLITFGLIRYWDAGNFVQTRLCCVFLTILSSLFWLFLCKCDIETMDSRSMYGLFILTFVWTLLFPVFALFASQPKV